MPYLMNCLQDSVSVQAQGKWFTFKAGEIKAFHNPKVAEFIAQYRGNEGIIQISDETMELDKNSQDYKSAIHDKRKEGITKRVAHLNYIIRNLEMSLRRDYETSGQKGNFLFEASAGELNAYKELKKYKEFEEKEKLNVADEIQKIRAELYGDSTTRPSPLEPAKKA